MDSLVNTAVICRSHNDGLRGSVAAMADARSCRSHNQSAHLRIGIIAGHELSRRISRPSRPRGILVVSLLNA